MRSPRLSGAFTLILLLIMCVLVPGVALAATPAERIVAGGMPECLHIGDTAEALVAFESENTGSAIEFSVRSEIGAVRASPDHVQVQGTPAAVTLWGNVFGEDSVTLSAPARPDLAPITAKISILPSIEPPRGVAAYPSEVTLPAFEGVEESGPYRIVVLTWWAKIGAKAYGIQVFDGERREIIRSIVSGGYSSFLAHVKPGGSYIWQIKAQIGTCAGGELWTPYSPLVPFDA